MNSQETSSQASSVSGHASYNQNETYSDDSQSEIVQKEREIQKCVCGEKAARTIEEAVENKCLGCIRTKLQRSQLELTESVKMQLFELGIEKQDVAFLRELLASEEMTSREVKVKAALLACQVDNPQVWELFKEYLGPLVLNDLRCYSATDCTSSKHCKYLGEAVENNCFSCFVKFIQDSTTLIDECQYSILIALINKNFKSLYIFAQFDSALETLDTTNLIKAVLRNDLTETQKHLNQAGKRCQGMTALMIASVFGFKEIVKVLLPLEGDVKDNRENAAACYAESFYDPELWRLFSHDISEERIKMFEQAHTSTCTCGGRSSSLINAAKNCCLKCCAKYLGQVRGKDDSGRTALMMAAENGRTDIARILLDREAGITDNHGNTALTYALQCHQMYAAAILAQNESELQSVDMTDLIKAVLINDLTGVQKHLDQAGKRCENITALMIAASMGFIEAVRLVACKEVGIKDDDGATALSLALLNTQRTEGVTECILFLSAFEEEYTQRCTKERVYIYLDDVRRLKPSFESLKNQIFNFGETALHLAARYNSLRLIRILRRELAGKKNYISQTALMVAAEKNNFRAVQMIMGYEGGQYNDYQQTSLMNIGYSNKIDALRYLRVIEASMIDDCGDNATLELIRYQKCTYELTLRTDKTIGWLYEGKSILETSISGQSIPNDVKQLIESNPIAMKEIELAKKHWTILKNQSIQEDEEDEEEEEEEQYELEASESDDSTIKDYERTWFYRQIQHENVFNQQILKAAVETQDSTETTNNRLVEKREVGNIQKRQCYFNIEKQLCKQRFRQILETM